MDNNIIFIIVGSSLLFVAVIIWKLRWLYKKIIVAEAEQQQTEKD